MPNKKFEFDLEGIDYGKLNTETDFNQEAKKLLPAAMKKAGRRVAETFWKESQKALGLANSQKAEFMREMESEYVSIPKEKKRIERLLIENLKEKKQRCSKSE